VEPSLPREPLDPVELSRLRRPMYTRSGFGAVWNIKIRILESKTWIHLTEKNTSTCNCTVQENEEGRGTLPAIFQKINHKGQKKLNGQDNHAN
jgi:hypothetical protein